MKTAQLERQSRASMPMSREAKLRLLQGYSARAGHLMLNNGQELAALFSEAAKPEAYDGGQALHREILERLLSEDKAVRGEAQAEWQEMVIFTVENFLYPSSNYVRFFETAVLGEADQPWFENVEHFEVDINVVGQDGGAPRWQAQTAHSKFMIPPYRLSSDELEYPLFDDLTGKIADRSKMNIDIAGDLGWKLDARLFGNLQDLIGPFTLTGDKLSRVYLPHSRINTANLPTTNLLVPADNTPTSIFRKSCLDAIIAYCRAWGDNLFGDGPLIPVSVSVPSAHITGFLADCLIHDPDNQLNRQVFDFGVIMQYGGYKWMFIADNTLSPTDGLAYVQFNKPVGKHWSKPAGDRLIIDDSKALQKENRESMLMNKLFFTAIPSNRRMNIAAVHYRS
jgi:hypothetical protein